VAKNAVAKTWSLTVSSDGWVYSGPPIDLTAPTPPVIAALTDITDTSVTVRVSTASVDSQSGVQDYVFYFAPTATLAYVETVPVAPDVAVAGYTITGLAPSTAYSVYAKARDASPLNNISVASNVVTGTTAAAIPNTSWFPNWPIMNCSCQQGTITSGLLSTAERDYSGEKDFVIFQWFYPTDTRLASRSAGLGYIRTNYPGCKLAMYTIPNETMKTVGTATNDTRELTKALIEGPNGNLNWYARRLNGDTTEAQFDPVNYRQCNMATMDAGLNNLGERYDQAFYRVIDTSFNGGTPANFLDTYVDAIFVDNLNAMPPSFYITNGASTVTDMDFDDDGVVDVKNLYSSASNAGGRMWAEGGLAIKETIESRFDLMCVPNAARWAFNYFDAPGITPPLPLSEHPFYGQWAGLILKETFSRDMGFVKTATGYAFDGGGGANLAFRRLTIHEKFLGPDEDSYAGRSAVLLESNAFNRTPIAADYDYARFLSACALLMGRCAPCVSIAANRAMPLDELFLELGAPVGDRSMGTLNESTLAWTLRSPDFENGVADFYWARFAKGIVVVRLDSPAVGAYPSADAAVSCTLPAAGTGKKWQRVNAATYVSPAIYAAPNTTRAMRSQNTTLNSGADASTVSLKPFHAAFIRLVDA
jgi:hypothetical protein